MSWYIAALKNYAGFKGRARRTEYWMFVLFNYLAVILLGIIGGAGAILVAELTGSIWALLFLVPQALYALGAIIPTLAVVVRRLHDTGRTGWWYLISFVPFGSIVMLVFMVLEGEPGENKHGPNPKPLVVPYGYPPANTSQPQPV